MATSPLLFFILLEKVFVLGTTAEAYGKSYGLPTDYGNLYIGCRLSQHPRCRSFKLEREVVPAAVVLNVRLLEVAMYDPGLEQSPEVYVTGS